MESQLVMFNVIQVYLNNRKFKFHGGQIPLNMINTKLDLELWENFYYNKEN